MIDILKYWRVFHRLFQSPRSVNKFTIQHDLPPTEKIHKNLVLNVYISETKDLTTLKATIPCSISWTCFTSYYSNLVDDLHL